MPGMPLNPSKFTKNTKVLLSFGARDGGYDFARLLREELMAIRGYTDPCAVYFDAISARNHPMGVVQVIKDTKTGVTSKQFRNQEWRQLYEAAMRNAKAMVFVATPAWAASKFCADENDMFQRIRDGDHDVPVRLLQHLPVIVLLHSEAQDALRNSGRLAAQAAAVVSRRLAALHASEKLVRRNLRRADGALIVMEPGETPQTVAPKVHQTLLQLGV